MTPAEKLGAAIRQARKYLSPEIGDKLQVLVSPEALAIIAATATAWAAGHLFGVSEVVDASLIAVAAIALGSEAISATKDLASFVSIALDAKSASDLDQAGRHFARFVTTVGVDAAIAFLLYRTIKSSKGRAALANKPTLRPDVSLSEAGRSGQNVKFLTAPPNSVVKSTAPGRVFVTDAQGQVILDITIERVKPVTPRVGFGDKRSPTPEELEWIKLFWGRI
ncbi:MAG TPA: hypothetical protein VN844_22625 [Pyrinomonadaceae bacterium]|nr:hypothetical protein [Pyrinomonadaceae bacterium]